VSVGNPYDGLHLVGPFDSAESAVEWAEINREDGNWELVELSNPEGD
jgi:hypothetical protein